jgi:hypothetical protein
MRLPSLKSRTVTKEPERILVGLFHRMALDLGLAQNKTVIHAEGLLSSRKYLSFLRLADSWSAQSYASAAETAAWNQLACLLKKYPFDDPSIDREAAAKKKFLAAEHSCKRVNQRLRARHSSRKTLPHVDAIQRCREFIRRVLGNSPDLGAILDMCDFGPGASVGVHGSATHSAAKLNGCWSVTPSCAPYALAALRRNVQVWESLSDNPLICFDPEWFQSEFDKRVKFVSANNIIFVPKTALIHRTIAIEPTLNGYVQKGIDKFMRGRLAKFGIDLSCQKRNQRLAREGSLGGFNPLVTIDLSSASDTISLEIVKLLLPRDWWVFLCSIRSPEYNLEGQTFPYEKFSSMGNGFSFPLESLIFAAVVEACYSVTGDETYAIYGDDIICRQSSALLVLELLKYFGFSTNVDKTFIFGSFRESCGADYFEGVNVRPYYIDEVPRNWDDIFKWLNGISDKHGYCSSWNYLFETIPESWRFTRPYTGADDAISVELDTHMGSPHSSYDGAIQNWRWARVISVAVSDTRQFPVGSQMYGLLRGAVSDNGSPQFAFRRKTRTRLAYSS